MKRILVFLFLICIRFGYGQAIKDIISIRGIYGQILSNNLMGTSLNYNQYPAFSGVNLKCTSIMGMQLQYKHFIKDSKWFYLLDYSRNLINYTTTLYSLNYDQNTEFNKVKELSYDTQIESFSAGAGRRFVVPNSRFYIDLSADFSFQYYHDYKIGSLSPIDFLKTTVLEIGDFNYFVELDFTYYARQPKFSVQSSISYIINQRFDLNFLIALSNPIIGEYKYENLTRGIDEVIIPGQLTVTNMESSSFNPIGRVATKYLRYGLGLNIKI